ncbi:MAG TPA: PQQ-binding-like beta-propeller repeat protein [Pirellulaceae bacterium]|nr:PQQ-binding-like beta-propeller repeat protein [Pirellulaceae bacterium]
MAGFWRLVRQAAPTVLIGLALAQCAASAGDWVRFRGPNGSGVSADSKPTPTTWTPTENLKWKVPLPGPGSSSPILVGDKLFITCWSGYGVGRGQAGDQKNLRRHLLCIDRKTGSTVWTRDVEPVLPEDQYGGMFAEHGYASHSPVSDGERVYVYFGKSGALAFDLEGKQLWQTKLGTGSDPRGWGSASSPILYKDLVIVTASSESESIVALDKTTGKVVWKQEADGFRGTWGTPVLVEAEGRTDLVIGVPYEIWGFDPQNGKLRWYVEAMNTDSYCSSVVSDGSVVYGIEGRGGGSIAVRAGGKDDVSKSHVVWRGRDANRIGTPVIHDGRIYFFSGRVANCIDAKTGEKIYQSRLTGGAGGDAAVAGGPGGGPGGGGPGGRGPGGPGGPGGAPGGPGGAGPGGGPGGRGPGGFGGGFGGGGGMRGQDYASPVAADGKLYFVARGGDIFVVQLGKEFKQLAVNRVTADSEDFSATPAIADGELFIRSNKHLYCVADTKGAAGK